MSKLLWNNPCKIEIAFCNVFLLYLHLEKFLLVLFYIIWGATAQRNFIPAIPSYFSLFSMTFSSIWKLLSKVPSERVYPTKIHSLKHTRKNSFIFKDSTSFPWMCYRFYWHSTYCVSFSRENRTDFFIF